MLTYLRYSLATFCFAASVGCLALWWRSKSTPERFEVLPSPWVIETQGGFAAIGPLPDAMVENFATWHSTNLPELFGRVPQAIYFPLWYPAVVFALAGVGVLRVGRFTIRSALIATTVVAGLLGMAVVL